jgi:hypothetical protein
MHVVSHGIRGTIEAAPADGRGTTFTVRLPLAPVLRQEDRCADETKPVSVQAAVVDERLSILPMAVREVATMGS